MSIKTERRKHGVFLFAQKQEQLLGGKGREPWGRQLCMPTPKQT